MYGNVAKSYQQTQFFTANPLKLILMCYEGAIANLKLARDHYMAGQYEEKAKTLQKTLDIIHELNASLDVKKGGDIAQNLRSLYQYMTQILTEADLKKDIKVFDNVIAMLEELESAWHEIVNARPENICPVPQGAREAASQAAISNRVWSV